jgi:serine/threonine-protein kinase
VSDVIPSGTILAERYRIERQIGAGGMGRVYRATQLGLERPVAIKVITPSDASAMLARRRFEREARVTSALRHPNAVEIYDFGLHGNTMFLAMELLSGDSLRDLVDIDLPPLSPRRVCQIGSDVADVLASAGEIGLVHRDLKPENIMLDYTGEKERTVVVDFGLAYIAHDDDMGRLTAHGVGVGTPDYLSPEQARGGEITPASDVYSLGCVLYEMLTTVPPFEGKQGLLMTQHIFVPPLPMRDRAPHLEIPSALDEIVLQMLSKAPRDRPSALGVVHALRSLDPNAHERGGVDDATKLLGRPARMVSKLPVKTGQATQTEDDWLEVDIAIATVGTIDEELKIGLAANGIQIVPIQNGTGDVPLGVLAVFAPWADASQVSALAETGLPVLSDADASDIQRLTELLRAGAAEVVIRPCSPESTARLVWRAVRKGKS